MSSNIKVNWLGVIDIEEGFKQQTQIIEANLENTIEVLGCEHHEVLSLGKSLWNQEVSSQFGDFRQIHKTQRGGKLTLHNPGQLIIYPVMNLKSVGLTLKEYVCLLVKSSSDCLLKYGLVTESQTKEQIGVYFGHKKIVSIGLHFRSGWVSHGLSINVSNELSKFEAFDICGHKELQVTSLKKENIEVTTVDVFETWVKCFSENLQSQKQTLSKQCVQNLNVKVENFRNFN